MTKESPPARPWHRKIDDQERNTPGDLDEFRSESIRHSPIDTEKH